jgi:hypothetical protein
MNKNKGIAIIFGLLIIGVFVIDVVSAFEISDYVSGNWRETILFLIVLVIMFAVIYDITMFFPFISSPWVRYVIAGGLTVAVLVLGWVQWLSDYALTWAAGLGAFTVFFLIIGGFVMLIALASGHNLIMRWATRVRMGMEAMRADRAAHETAQTIRSLREIHDELENA